MNSIFRFSTIAVAAVLASNADAQVDYNALSYRVVLTQTQVNTALSNPTPAHIRYAVTADPATNRAYAIAQQAATPFLDALFSIDLSTTPTVPTLADNNLDSDPALASGFGTFFNVNARELKFTQGRLLAAINGPTTAWSAIAEINPANGNISIVLPSQTGTSPIVGIAPVGSNLVALQQSGTVGNLLLLDLSNSNVTTVSAAATPNANGIVADASGDLFVVAQTGTAAATIKRIQNVTGTPVTSDVTPTVTAWTSENMQNTRGVAIANGDLLITKRGASTPTDYRLYIVRGNNLLRTITGAEIATALQALGFTGATVDVQDTHGFDAVAISATQARVYLGARDVTGGWGVAELTFGLPSFPASVNDWALFE